VIWLETPTNPMLNVLDIEHIREACREKVLSMGIAPEKVFLVVDNTFATPALQQPISLGADLVIHSATKYIGGHSDLVGGAVIAARGSNLDPIRFYQNAAGGVPSPFDCYLAHRGLKTLTVRMRQHCENAARIAEWLQQHPAIEKVIYPGLKEHPHHETAARQMCGFGGMVSCVVRGGLPAVEKVTAAVAVFACAESLGGVESLLNHPAIMTHASVPEDVRARLGIVDGLIRLSVGIEDVEDLIEDLDQALAAV
jgi:cystathionine gamma-lyase